MPKLVVTGEFRLELEGAVPGKLEELVTGVKVEEPVPMGAVPELVPGMVDEEPVPMGAVPELVPVPMGAVPVGVKKMVVVDAVDTVLLGKMTGVVELPVGAVGPKEPVGAVTGTTGVELGIGAVPLLPVGEIELLSVPVRGKPV